jgi:hypothetical protein
MDDVDMGKTHYYGDDCIPPHVPPERATEPPFDYHGRCVLHGRLDCPPCEVAEAATEPPFDYHAPVTVTAYGAIAYRIDAVAEAIAADPNVPDEPGRYARTLWGIVDDLVALNLESTRG